MNETIIILAMLITCLGILLYFVGWINTIFMALGKDQKIVGVTVFIFNPLAIIYCIKYWHDAKTQGLQLIIGLLIMCSTIIPAYLYYTKNIVS